MRLVFQYQPATGGLRTVVLADTETPVAPRTQRDGMADYRPSGRCLVQENPLPDAQDMQVFTRKNRALAISFQVERCHGSEDEATKFALDELDLIGKRGTLIDDRTNPVRFPLGVMESVECLYHWGLTTIHRYAFRCGTSTGPRSAYPTQ